MTDSAFEVQGQWWLPGQEDDRVSGTLRFDPQHGSELRLIGRLRDPMNFAEREQSDDGSVVMSVTSETLERAGVYERIHGAVGSTAYTLDDCFRTRATNVMFSSGGATEVIHVNRVLKSVLFDAGEPLEATICTFDLRYLTAWMTETGIDETHYFAEDRENRSDEPYWTLAARGLDSRSAGLDGYRLSIEHSVGIKGDRINERSLTQRFYARITADKMRDVDELAELASDLQDLVAIGTGRDAVVEGMSFRRPDLVEKIGPTGEREVPIEYFVPWSVRDSSKKPGELQPHEMYFSFQQLGEMDGVARWMNAADKHRSALGRVMSTRYSPQMFVSDRLLNCAAALEAFDRVSTGFGGSKFKTRMIRCAKLAGSAFTDLVGDIDQWAESIRLSRDDLAHHLGRTPERKGSTQYFLGQSVYWLFVLCMLREAEARAEVFDQIAGSQQLLWLKPKVQAAVAG
jgi:hypothetical protein